MVHVVVVILSTGTVYGLTEEWFMLLLLYFLPLLFKDNRGEDHVVVVVVILSTITVLDLTEEWFMLLLYCLSLLFNVYQKVCSCCGCYVVYHYCFKFYRGVVHVVVCYIVYHYCLRFYKTVV